jgi:hypothetical protein
VFVAVGVGKKRSDVSVDGDSGVSKSEDSTAVGVDLAEPGVLESREGESPVHESRAAEK